MEEAAIRDLDHYKNLSELFRRRLRPGIRPIDKNCAVVSLIICADDNTKRMLTTRIDYAFDFLCFQWF